MNEQRMKELADRACVLGMAAVACYGRRDSNGLAGKSKEHYEELCSIREQIMCICKAHPKTGEWLDIDCPYHGNRYRAEMGEKDGPA